MSGPVRLSLFLLLVVVVAVSGSQTKRKTLNDSPNSISIEEDLIAKDRARRTLKKATKALGFFGTVKQLLYEQINDTKSAYNQISGLINNNFDDGDQKKQSSKSVTSAPSSLELTDSGEATTTDPPPKKASRDEFLGIIRRNLIGLRRLFDKEWKLAMEDSKKNLREYKKELGSQMKIHTN